MSGDSVYALVQLVIALPFLLCWPCWLATRLLGAPWTVVVVRAGHVDRTERVRGWRASERRIVELLASVQSGRVSLPNAGGLTS